MNLQSVDLIHLRKLTSYQVEQVTCLECCKYYIAPETTSCGHSLCHTCWRKRRTCPVCAAPLEKKALKLNLQLQTLTEHVHTFVEAFEKLFKINLDEVALEDIEKENDPSINVKEWLASSQNQFSAPIVHSEPFSQGSSDTVEILKSKIDIHVSTKKSISPQKVLFVPPPQDDWDKIEQLPDTEEMTVQNKENSTNETNKQLCLINEEYTTYNPRRSSRKRESSNLNEISGMQDINTEKTSSKLSSSEPEKKSNKAKQNWNNVKRMRKEFSKLNKKNRSKLNVSIEMCKRNQSNVNKPPNNEQEMLHKDSQPPFSIEDNTPDLHSNDKNGQNNAIRSASNEPLKSISNGNDHVNKSTEVETENVINGSNPNAITKQNNLDQDNILPVKNMCEDTNTVINKSLNASYKVPFIKKNNVCPNCTESNNQSMADTSKLDDIEITFKVGNTVTNITIKRKNNDVQLKVKADCEVQTSLGTNGLVNEHNGEVSSQPHEIEINLGENKTVSGTKIGAECVKVNNCEILKSTSTKKHTASEDTATAQFEITESVEKELSKIMECVDGNNENMDVETDVGNLQSQRDFENRSNNHNPDNYLNDLDIFDTESVQEQLVQSLSKSKQTPSEILMPTNKTKSQKHPDKRNREDNDDIVPQAKKIKTILNDCETTVNITDDSLLKPSHRDNDSINYDVVMGKVFASIDADIEKSQRTTKPKPMNNKKAVTNPQHSENIFPTQKTPQVISSHTGELNKENDCDALIQRQVDNLLTPGMCQDLIATHQDNMEIINKDQFTPYHEVEDDSDKSVVEETPQKNVSFSKPKNVSNVTVIPNQLQRGNSKVMYSSQSVKSIINVSDTLVETTKPSRDQTTFETVAKKQTLETPLTINKFVDQIKHKSTPLARKSLNFESENIDDVDLEQTICPSSAAVKTTQEREFMAKVFEQSPTSPVTKPKSAKKAGVELKYCIAGSCLTPSELTNLKMLCHKNKWRYLDKYSSELTHLIVGLDKENKSQRSVKYMCALAASKWIVAYEWVDVCIRTSAIVDESPYEALDATGEPGPTRSRLAQRKLFQGIIFYCMPPFSVLDVDTLKEMLEAAGGRVVADVKAARAVGEAPALLLAEPEDTQEDKFMYLALELNIVPVNYEWVLNCLGAYSLSSLHGQLMCSAALLPPATAKWPPVLISRDND